MPLRDASNETKITVVQMCSLLNSYLQTGDRKDYEIEIHKNVNHGNDKMSRIEEFRMIRNFESNQIKCSAKCKKANRTKQFKTTANNTYPKLPKVFSFS
jgi:hypothetical protein